MFWEPSSKLTIKTDSLFKKEDVSLNEDFLEEDEIKDFSLYCSICSVSFDSEEETKSHMKMNHKYIPCNNSNCASVFTKYEDWVEHCKIHLDPEQER